MKVAEGIKVAHELTLRWKMLLDDLGGANVITRVLKRGRGRQKSQYSM